MRFLWLLTLLVGMVAHAGTIVGRVVGVADGDTLTVLDADRMQHVIRLEGIDAPEKRQAFGSRAKESLSQLSFGKRVEVLTRKKDRYGRAVGKVLVDGVDVNLEQIRRGYAWHYKAYQLEQAASDRNLYDAAEKEARDAIRGLWHEAAPVPPWEFRRVKRITTSDATGQ